MAKDLKLVANAAHARGGRARARLARRGGCALVLLCSALLTAAPSIAWARADAAGSKVSAAETRGTTERTSCQVPRYWARAGIHLRQSGRLGERLLAERLLRLQASFDEACGINGPAVGDQEFLQPLLDEVLASTDPLDLALATQIGLAPDDSAQLRALVDRWAELEPDNIAPMVHGRAPIEALLSETGRRNQYDSHTHALVRLFFSVFLQVPKSRDESLGDHGDGVLGPEAEALTAAWSLWAAIGLPAFQTLTQPCKGEELRTIAVRQEQCLRLGRSLALRSEAVIEASIGIAILQNAASSPADRQLATDLRNTMDWQRARWLEALSTMNDEAQAAHAIRMLHTPGIESELQAMRATIEEHGMPLLPPAGWQPGPRAITSGQ